MSVFSIGACRTQAAIWESSPVFGDRRFDNLVVCHYASEIIQIINFLNSKTRIDRKNFNTVFTDARACLMRKKEIQLRLNEADKFVVEISSIKNLKKDGVYHNINRVPKKDVSNYELYYDTEEDVIEKMSVVDGLLNHKPILFVPHVNVEVPGTGFIRQRGILQKCVQQGSESLDQSFFDIMSCVNRLGIDKSFPVKKGKLDVNHLSPAAVSSVKECIQKFLSS